ncbi:N-acyl-D-amino-acid deacylase family protein [Pseudactinotalea sp.]|uniref:N-acyl-D-amino-acid deacylase family protein n=1 Tax=Pseudactinotalea sp. TaxID=1926260 RepID=UPI003B3B57AA
MSPTLVIEGGVVADGTGGEPAAADVVLCGDTVSDLVPLAARPAGGYDARTLDASGRVVAPGFVDLHSHSDLSLLAYPGNASRVTQGITTEVVGNCGMSPAPGNGDRHGLAEVIATIDVVPGRPWQWHDVASWLAVLDGTPTATNVAALVGHSAARFAVAGMRGGPLRAHERARLVRLLEDAIEAGCLGVSLGLMYPPGEHADTAELVAVAGVAARVDALLTAHLRDYRGSQLRAAAAEVVDVAESTGSRVQLSHLRAVGESADFTRVVDDLGQRRQVVDLAADAYPYTAGHTTLTQLLPRELRARGPRAVAAACHAEPTCTARALASCGYPAEDITVMKATATPDVVGRSAAAADGAAGPWLWLVELLAANDGLVDVAVVSGRWPDVDHVLSMPWVSVASDGTALESEHTSSVPHPRSWGTFPAAYRRMRALGVPIGEAIRRMSAAPAARVGLNRVLQRGAVADIVVLDEAALDSQATYPRPAVPAVGVDHVLVRGTAVLSHGRRTTARPGRLIRKDAA